MAGGADQGERPGFETCSHQWLAVALGKSLVFSEPQVPCL